MEKDEMFETIKRINVAFLLLARKVGALKDKRGFVQTVLVIDDQTLQQLMALNHDEIDKIASEAVPVFKLKINDLQNVSQLLKKGNTDKAASLIRAGLIAHPGAKEIEA